MEKGENHERNFFLLQFLVIKYYIFHFSKIKYKYDKIYNMIEERYKKMKNIDKIFKINRCLCIYYYL